MPYAVTCDSRVSVAFRCDRCGFEDRYPQQPACNIICDAEHDGWTFHDEYEKVAWCPECSDAPCNDPLCQLCTGQRADVRHVRTTALPEPNSGAISAATRGD